MAEGYRGHGPVSRSWRPRVLDGRSARKLPAPIIGRRGNDAGVYEEIPVSPSGGTPSHVLGAELFVEDEVLRFRDLTTGEVVPTYSKLRERDLVALRAAEARARREATACEAAEERIAVLEQRLRRSGGGQ